MGTQRVITVHISMLKTTNQSIFSLFFLPRCELSGGNVTYDICVYSSEPHVTFNKVFCMLIQCKNDIKQLTSASSPLSMSCLGESLAMLHTSD